MLRTRNTVIALLIGGLIGGLISGCSYTRQITVPADESRCVKDGSLSGGTVPCDRPRAGWEGASIGALAVDLK